MSDKESGSDVTGIDYGRPLQYSCDKALEVACQMLARVFDGTVPLEVTRVLEDMYMAGAFHALDILTYGQDYDEGNITSVDYSLMVLSEEAADASDIIEILESRADDDEEGSGGSGVPVVIPTSLH
jgi:hypothetical protein